MNKESIFKKGYQINIVDNNCDKCSIHFEDKGLAIAVAKMCYELFCPQWWDDDGNYYGVGDVWLSSEDDVTECDNIVIDYMNGNRLLLCESFGYDPLQSFKYWENRLGLYSEEYYTNWVDNVTLTYSPEDIYVERIDLENFLT